MSRVVVAMVSMERQSGNTTLSLLSGMLLDILHGRRVCVTHTSETDASLMHYLGYSSTVDMTITPMQILKLVREGGLNAADFGDYCKHLGTGCEVFSNAAGGVSLEDSLFLLQFILRNPTYDVILVDVNTDLSGDLAQAVLSSADTIVLNMGTSFHTLDKFKESKGGVFKKYIAKKKFYFLANYYHVDCFSMQTFAKRLGVRQSNCFRVHFSPYIVSFCNQGKLLKLATYLGAKDVDVADVAGDLSSFILGLNGGLPNTKKSMLPTKVKGADSTGFVTSVPVVGAGGQQGAYVAPNSYALPNSYPMQAPSTGYPAQDGYALQGGYQGQAQGQGPVQGQGQGPVQGGYPVQ